MKQKTLSASIGIAVSMLTITASHAEDIEIFTAHTSTSPNSNVVFVLDTSGSMRQRPMGQNSGPTKIQIVKDVFEELIYGPPPPGSNTPDHNSINPDTNNLNFSLMRFDVGRSNDSQGGFFITEMQTLNETTKNDIWGAVNALTADGWTPLAETGYEVTRYFRGLTPQYGANSTFNLNDTGTNYVSPFSLVGQNEECAINNHLVILTDGMPTRDDNADTDINGLKTFTETCAFSDTQGTDCLAHVAEYLHDTDFLGEVDGFPVIDGHQNVKTHTIAFDIDRQETIDFLRDVAIKGGGVAIEAGDSSELSQALTDVITDVLRSAKSFVRPAAAISSTNRYANDNTLYFSLFEPEVSPQWTGNVKGYFIDENGVIRDVNGAAVFDANGNFNQNISSKWSTNDGEVIGAGGAADQFLDQASRNIYTQYPANPLRNQLVDFSAADPADLGFTDPNDPEIAALIDWASSRDSNPIGDPLHSNLQVVNYGEDIGSVIFFATNEGFLHAIDADTGREKFAFIPQALLSNLQTFKDNLSGASHPYGLDGPISMLVRDANNNGNIEPGTEDKVIIIVGMRRGGSNYYALDVTNPNVAPTLLWQITGGSDDFPDLGQTWSRAIITKVKTGNPSSPIIRDIAIFGGGNDVQYDDGTIPDTNAITGNAIYAVDLLSGAPVWCASSSAAACDTIASTNQLFNGQSSITIPEMVHAFPSTISGIDLNSDGALDRLYTIDVTGNIFRIDFDARQGSGDTEQFISEGQLFANIAGGDRRYYNAIDVAGSKQGIQPMIHLNVGSGQRPNPLKPDSLNKFYSIQDVYVFNGLPDIFSVITESNLNNANSTTTLADAKGWYFDLVDTGEKVLSQAATRAGYVFFTSYKPPAPRDPNSPQRCEPPLGDAYIYIVALTDSDGFTDDRRIVLQADGIPPEAAFLTIERENPTPNPDEPFANTDTNTVVLVGTELVELPDPDDQRTLENLLNQTAEKIYWQQN